MCIKHQGTKTTNRGETFLEFRIVSDHILTYLKSFIIIYSIYSAWWGLRGIDYEKGAATTNNASPGSNPWLPHAPKNVISRSYPDSDHQIRHSAIRVRVFFYSPWSGIRVRANIKQKHPEHIKKIYTYHISISLQNNQKRHIRIFFPHKIIKKQS